MTAVGPPRNHSSKSTVAQPLCDCPHRLPGPCLNGDAKPADGRTGCAFFEKLGTATILIAPDMTITMANPKVTEEFGYARDEVVSHSFLEFLTPEFREMSKLYHEMVLYRKVVPPKVRKFSIYDKQGNIREVAARLGWVGHGPHVIISLIDHTKIRHAEREYHNLSEIVEQSAESILLTDVHGRIVYVNKAFETLSGYLRYEILNGDAEHPFFSEQDRLAFKKMGFSATCGDVIEHRSQNIHKDGSAVATKTRIAALCDTKGRLTKLVCIKKDITRETEFEQQLYEAQKMEAIGTLSSGIAHDFNNILGGIMGYAEMAIQPSADQTKVRRYMTRILQACERARDLTSQILAFSRHKDYEYQPVHIQPLINEALKLLRATTPATIEFRKNLAAAKSVILADPTRIHQIIMNLCTNASQAMDSTGGVLEVKLENVPPPAGIAREDPGDEETAFVILRVRDTGHGIDPQSLDHIFEPYFTTKAATGGTGLGLSVVQSIVKTMGGTITVHSRPGEGSTFEIVLPCLENAEPQSKELEQLLPRGQERVLIIDDEAFMLEVFHDMLTALGYQVETAEGAQFVLERLRKDPKRYDLVIADLTMPHMNGRELSARIRDLTEALPVILCTGMSYTLEQFNVDIPNIKALLPKPIQYDRLALTVREVLDGK